jgi:hypothetical protein
LQEVLECCQRVGQENRVRMEELVAEVADGGVGRLVFPYTLARSALHFDQGY